MNTAVCAGISGRVQEQRPGNSAREHNVDWQQAEEGQVARCTTVKIDDVVANLGQDEYEHSQCPLMQCGSCIHMGCVMLPANTRTHALKSSLPFRNNPATASSRMAISPLSLPSACLLHHCHTCLQPC